MSDFSEIIEQKHIEFRLNEPLSAHSTFRIGGAADFFVEPKNESELAVVLNAAKDTGTNFYVIGRGSNLLFSDSGFRGVVVSLNHLGGVEVSGTSLKAYCGASLSSVALAAQRASLDGVRFLYGIPGSVGGGVYMNAGAFGGEIGSALVSTRYYDSELGSFGTLDKVGHEFSYRHSSYMDHPERIVVSATFELFSGNAAEIKADMDEIMEKRKSTQPLEYPSAGSVFKRGNGFITAKLIDEAGLKGTRIGGAMISEKHAGFIVNLGNATANDVTELIELVREKIYERYGVNIESEVRIIGET